MACNNDFQPEMAMFRRGCMFFPLGQILSANESLFFYVPPSLQDIYSTV
jgi:hypothetical protein